MYPPGLPPSLRAGRSMALRRHKAFPLIRARLSDVSSGAYTEKRNENMSPFVHNARKDCVILFHTNEREKKHGIH